VKSSHKEAAKANAAQKEAAQSKAIEKRPRSPKKFKEVAA
jgi:hypothetical protein